MDGQRWKFDPQNPPLDTPLNVAKKTIRGDPNFNLEEGSDYVPEF